jgi:lipoprotein-anchoring transpeptidase ErfK/SrfK
LRRLSLAIIALLLCIAVIAGVSYIETRAASGTLDRHNDSDRPNSSHTTPPATNNGEKPGQLEEQSAEPSYRIEVSTDEQKVRIYDNDNLLKEWTVSTGENNSTPLGDFVIQNRGEWFYSEKYQEGARWWVSFKDWGVYLFHSVPMDRRGNIREEEADKLGEPASHGCVRLKVEQAKWIYDNIPEGTPVHIE